MRWVALSEGCLMGGVGVLGRVQCELRGGDRHSVQELLKGCLSRLQLVTLIFIVRFRVSCDQVDKNTIILSQGMSRRAIFTTDQSLTKMRWNCFPLPGKPWYLGSDLDLVCSGALCTQSKHHRVPFWRQKRVCSGPAACTSRPLRTVARTPLLRIRRLPSRQLVKETPGDWEAWESWGPYELIPTDLLRRGQRLLRSTMGECVRDLEQLRFPTFIDRLLQIIE